MVIPRQHGPRRRASRRGERGYTLVAVAVMITVLSIGVAMVLPAWSAQIQRDREEELVFRGLQYAEAIRVFQRRFGRFPNTLSELVEVKPRCIRRLWTEPMTEGGAWQVIPFGPPDPSNAGGTNADGRAPDADEPGADGAAAVPPPTGPIIGVRSTSSKTGFRTFFGQDAYNQWRFTYDLVSPGGGELSVEGVGVPGAGLNVGARIPRAAWIGRPLPGVSGPPPLPGQGEPVGSGTPVGRQPVKPRSQAGDDEK